VHNKELSDPKFDKTPKIIDEGDVIKEIHLPRNFFSDAEAFHVVMVAKLLAAYPNAKLEVY